MKDLFLERSVATHAVLGGKNWHDWRMQFPQAGAATQGLILPFGSGVNYPHALTWVRVGLRMAALQ